MKTTSDGCSSSPCRRPTDQLRRPDPPISGKGATTRSPRSRGALEGRYYDETGSGGRRVGSGSSSHCGLKLATGRPFDGASSEVEPKTITVLASTPMKPAALENDPTLTRRPRGTVREHNRSIAPTRIKRVTDITVAPIASVELPRHVPLGNKTAAGRGRSRASDRRCQDRRRGRGRQVVSVTRRQRRVARHGTNVADPERGGRPVQPLKQLRASPIPERPHRERDRWS